MFTGMLATLCLKFLGAHGGLFWLYAAEKKGKLDTIP